MQEYQDQRIAFMKEKFRQKDEKRDYAMKLMYKQLKDTVRLLPSKITKYGTDKI